MQGDNFSQNSGREELHGAKTRRSGHSTKSILANKEIPFPKETDEERKLKTQEPMKCANTKGVKGSREG